MVSIYLLFIQDEPTCIIIPKSPSYSLGIPLGVLHSLALDKSYVGPPLQNPTEYFLSPENHLWSASLLPALTPASSLHIDHTVVFVCIILPFPDCSRVGILQCVSLAFQISFVYVVISIEVSSMSKQARIAFSFFFLSTK